MNTQPYKDLPILRDAKSLLVRLEQTVKDFPRYHKYTLGSDLRQQSYKVVRMIVFCIQTKQNRVHNVQRLFLMIEDLKTQLQIGKELAVYQNFKQFEGLAKMTFDLSKQVKSWQNKLQQRANQP